MSNISNAKTALNYYIQKAWEAEGLSWDSDNEAEVNAIVDGIVDGIKEELKSEVLRIVKKIQLSNARNAKI